ncbi:Hypothetical predicted protein [Podarcis lilfordi]|uniref:Uncharacterized protein n=1 Tax=Podarcis lilfordi TaxID=74358 RepID=A0AA35LIA7_9SAUR|nr:Hypothetical predicted protein [Podarcis lilfordi]
MPELHYSHTVSCSIWTSCSSAAKGECENWALVTVLVGNVCWAVVLSKEHGQSFQRATESCTLGNERQGWANGKGFGNPVSLKVVQRSTFLTGFRATTDCPSP